MSVRPIREVLIYTGHKEGSVLGPYLQNIQNKIEMFNLMNLYREECGRLPWKLAQISGEQILEALNSVNVRETLLVVPAGKSRDLDQAFSLEQTAAMVEFMTKGGRGYFTCGSAYWVCRKIRYVDLAAEEEFTKESSVLPLFNGVAKGPLHPYAGKKYHVGYTTRVASVTNGQQECKLFLAGGGSFFPYVGEQKSKILVRYTESELLDAGKYAEEARLWENASLLAKVGDGAAVLSMLHPTYGANENLSGEDYKRYFPEETGTDWEVVKERVDPLENRMRFVLHSLIIPLEDS